jgi:capsid portal protein
MEYKVTIKATVYKTIAVDANSENEAYELAHDVFSVQRDEWPERYEEETVDIETA